MKKLIYGGLFLALLGIGIVGCKKEEVTNQQNANNSSNKIAKSTDPTGLPSEVEYEDDVIYFEYYFNNSLQENPDYQLDSLDNLIEGVEYEEEYRIKIHSFTNENAYNEFLSDYPDLQETLALDNEFIYLVHEFMDNNPEVIRECEDNDKCDEYLAFQDSLAEEIYGAQFSSKAPTTIRKGFCSDQSWMMTNRFVFLMAPGWDNQTSSFFNLNIVTRVNLYGHRFFQHRMRTFFGFHGWQCIPFIGGLSFLNNKTSSVIH